MILRGYNLGTLGWGTAKVAAPTGRVFYVDPAHPPNWIPAGSTIIYKSSTTAPATVTNTPTEQPRTPPMVQSELIPQYTTTAAPAQGLQRPMEIPIEQPVEKVTAETKAPEGGSIVPLIIAMIAAIVAGQ